MMKRMEVEGRAASVIYLTKDFVPCNKSEASIAQITYDDGAMQIVTLENKSTARSMRTPGIIGATMRASKFAG